MSEFARSIHPAALALLRHLAESPKDNWWKDLLRLWRPSGLPAGDDGLRLAIRHNYLNFYLRGQSVARVGFSRRHEPYIKTHVKYAFGTAETGKGYAVMRDGTNIRHPNTGDLQIYKGSSTLHGWIDRADKHKGDEKTCVDELIAANPSIIDVEIGLPAAGERKTAKRMDCVALERDQEGIRIVFWEAKTIDDPRLRSESEPEVIGQLKIYGDHLAVEDHARIIEDAYRTVCQLLSTMHEMVTRFSDRSALDPLVRAASKQTSVLKVDPTPRLVIFGSEQKKGQWEGHQKTLEQNGIPCLVLRNEPFRLRLPKGKS